MRVIEVTPGAYIVPDAVGAIETLRVVQELKSLKPLFGRALAINFFIARIRRNWTMTRSVSDWPKHMPHMCWQCPWKHNVAVDSMKGK